MRTLSLVACGCAIATLLWLIPQQSGQTAEPDQFAGLPSHALKRLLPPVAYPDEPLFLVVSPVPATLTEGVPPT